MLSKNQRTEFQNALLNKLQLLKETKYQEFASKLSPGVKILGVRNPLVRKLALKEFKTASNEDMLAPLFYDAYFEEKFIKAIFIGKIKMATEDKIKVVKEFLPLLDGWAITDGLCTLLRDCIESKEEWYEFIKPLFFKKDEPYTVRFAVVMTLIYFADDEHIEEIFEILKSVDDSHYYVHMAIAWCVATFYCNTKEHCLKLLKENIFSKKTYNKSLQKIIESRIPTDEEKEVIRKMKRS
ncbi:MAG: DNA alkylation repair protein [Succinivibrio sp.]